MTSALKQKKLYCFDTSAFIGLSRTSENIIELPETLWKHLENMMMAKEIISHRLVFEEISSNSKNPDFIARWIANKQECFLLKTDSQREHIPEIVKKCPDLIDYKMEREQADPWLIALAIEKSEENTLFEICAAIVVSQENPNSSKKIPAACKSFGIRHLSLRNFFDEIGLSTKLSKK